MGGWRRETVDAAMDNLQKKFNMTTLNIQVVDAHTGVFSQIPEYNNIRCTDPL